MTITISPSIEQLLKAEVAAGRFPSIEAAIEASVVFFRDACVSFENDPDLLNKIDRAEDSIERGEGHSSDEVKQILSKSIGVKVD